MSLADVTSNRPAGAEPDVASSAGGPVAEALRLCSVHLRTTLVFSAIINLAYLAPTIYMLQVYDRVMTSNSGSTLVLLTLALAMVLVLQITLDQLRQRVLLAASVRLDRVFSLRLFQRLLSTRSNEPQPRIGKALRDLDTIRAAATGQGVLALFDAPWIVIYVVVCFIVHWALGLAALMSAVVLFALAVLNERISKVHFKRAADAAALASASQDAASGSTDVIRALGMTQAFTRNFEDKRVGANLPQMTAQQATSKLGGLIRFLRLFLQSTALGLGAWLAISKAITPGEVFACSMLIARALAPIDQIVAHWKSLQSALTAYQGLKGLLHERVVRPLMPLPHPRARLKLDKVKVAYPDREEPVLKDITLDWEGGAVIAVLGPSGSGKTTLLQVMAGARQPESGDIRIDGARYEDWDAERLGRLIGYLPQDCVLFPGTVRDNISRFDRHREDAAQVDEKTLAAAKAARVHDFILGLPKGYETVIGPRGRGLSAGQQQRIAMARALYGEPVIYVLDEPNASLDAAGEAELVHVVSDLRKRGALVVLSTHRTQLISVADKVLILRAGAVERFGPAAEIISTLRPPPRPGLAMKALGDGTQKPS